jgi:crotonobetainyl-CoA:carnitine CoA-transferase CaiB-like acyl-CoA transferase
VGTIVDLTRLSAAYAARLLVEAGHRVVRIEPAAGDELRRLGPFLQGQPDLEHGAYHQFLNAGKESLTLDASTVSGRAVLLALIATADAAIVSRPFAVPAAALRAVNARLVLVEVDDVPNELTAYARSGLLALTGHPDQRPVILGGHAVFSAIGLYVGVAVAAGLFAVRRGGAGRHVEVSARQCMESLAEQAALTYHTTGETSERRGLRGAITAVSGAFPCADGYWMVSLPHSPEGWARLMNWVDDPELAADASLADEGRRQVRRDFILDRISAWSLKHLKDELVTQAQERHIPASPVATALDLAHDPQLLARGFLREMDHPDFGRLLFPVGAIARGKDVAPAPAPRLGANTAAILRELGFTGPEQQALMEGAVV